MSSTNVTQTPYTDRDVIHTVVDLEVTDFDQLSTSTMKSLDDAFLLEDVPLSKVIHGYAAPFFVAVTIVTNLLVCLVLVRPGMRSATNAVLVAVAFSDSMTGLAPLPCYIYFYTLGGQHDYVPYRWCFWYFCLIDYLPTVFHTASVWLTVLLAAQRYVCVCRGYLPKTRTARRRSVVVKIVVCIFILAVASQASRFAELDFVPVNATSLVEPQPTIVVGCQYTLTPFIARHEQAYFNSIFWFRVIFIHLIPCSALVVLTMLLVCALRTAQRRKRNLLARAALSATASAATVTAHQPQRGRGLLGILISPASQCSVPCDAPSATVAPSAAGTGHGARRSSNDGNNTTMMLVAVVSVFLAVEVPLAIVLILVIIQHTFAVVVLDPQAGVVASLVINFIIMISYPTNFFIYCAMSRAFRTTFESMFCIRSRSPPGGNTGDRGAGGDVAAITTKPIAMRLQRAGDRCPTHLRPVATPADRYLPMSEMVVTQTTDVSLMRKSRRSVTQF